MIIWHSQTCSMLIPIDEAVSYLAAHPLLLLLLLLFLAGLIFSLLKKVLKAALVFLLLFIAANAVVLYFADTEWGKKGKKMLDEGKKKAEQFIGTEGPKLLREGEKVIGSLPDSAKRDTAGPAVIKKPVRK